jgi:hypothetical protein
MSQRYLWKKPSDLPDRLELIDSGSNRIVAVITQAGRFWQWRRSTTPIFDGAPASEGECLSLLEAKDKVLDGLAIEVEKGPASRSAK